MSDISDFLSTEYQIEPATKSAALEQVKSMPQIETLPTTPPQPESLPKALPETSIDITRYGIAKPKRVILQGKLVND